jgi:tetratricopeptide (TPR) repeat protein
MSIVSALKSQEGSIRELAMLPQQQILKLAQMGQLNVSMVPIILSEKAQMVQQAANMQAMAQGTPASVTETDMATIAQAEAQQAPMGIEALPSGQQMYDEQSLAGGGIVAFEDGGAVPRFQVGGTFDMFMPDDADRTPFGEVAVPVELTGKLGLAQIYDIKSGKYGRTRDEILKAFNVAAPAPARAQAAPAAPAAAPVAPAAPEVTPVGIAAAAPRAAVPVAAAPAAPKQTAPTIEELIKEQQQYGPKGQAFEELEKEIRGSAEQKKADRQQNMWMRVAEAGFGIMSGQSPYALTNIGKGMSAAMQSYAEDLKEQKKLDREDRKTLADIQQARRAEAKGDYDKAANLREKALNRMSEDERARLQRETQERVARISASSRPSPFEEYLKNPEKYAEFSKAVRPGFENAETQRDRLALDIISNELLNTKKDDPRRKQLEQTRQSILQKILTPSFGGSLEAPADINALVKKYTTK